jgi:hypothetical protein
VFKRFLLMLAGATVTITVATGTGHGDVTHSRSATGWCAQVQIAGRLS